jgi:hypothetical protein
MFKERGFKDVNIVDMPYYKGAHMISPSGFNVMVMEHIK